MLLGLFVALLLGGALAFLLYGYPILRSVGRASPTLTRAAHLSLVWILGQWWAHGSLHINNGLDMDGLVVIDYVFHLPIMAASLVLVVFFLRVTRPAESVSEPRAAATA
jgi:ABC-type branched-subunit amino acid transport system permease subunit